MRAGSKPLFIGRSKEIEWLNRSAQFSAGLVIVGVRGIGKTWLIRNWVEQKNWKCKWYSADRLKSLSEIIGNEGDLESALERASLEWKDLDAVVWDDLSQIHPKSRNTLLSFLKATPGLPLQILLSDEEVPRNFLGDLSQLKLGPFESAEIQEFLKALDVSSPETLNEIEKKTGGVPLLLRLWLQSPDTQAELIHSIVEEFPESGKKIFSFAALLGRAMSYAELRSFFDSLSRDHQAKDHRAKEDLNSAFDSVMDSLHRKNLFERLPGAKEIARVPSYIRNLYLKELAVQDRDSLKKQLLSHLMAKKSVAPPESFDNFEIFILALDLQDLTAIHSVVLEVPLERLESLDKTDLQEVFKGLEAAFNSDSFDVDAGSRLARLTMRTLFLLGKRAESLEVAERFVNTVHRKTQKQASDETLLPEQQYFILEYTQLLNRTSQFEKAKRTAQTWMARFEDPVFSLLSIELGVSMIPSSLNEAMEVFERTLKKSETVLASGAATRDWKVVRTHSHFQLGRSLDLADRWKDSEYHFRVAYEGHRRDLGQTYFACVSAMNRAWLIFQQADWDRLVQVLQEVRSDAEKFGYYYVLAGISIIEAGKNRFFMQSGAALQKIEAGIQYLGQSPPMQPMVDALAEKIRILLQLGLHVRALQEFSRVERLVKQNPDSIVLEQQESLRMEIEFHALKYPDWIERWENSKHGRRTWRRLSLRSLPHPLPESVRQECQSFPLGRLAVGEAELFHALGKEDLDAVWHCISEMEKSLAEVTDPCVERIALLLLQAELLSSQEDGDRRENLLKQAELEWVRWGCDAVVKAPLQAWLLAIRSRSEKNVFPPEKDPHWRKSSAGDQDRWKKWWIHFWKPPSKKFQIKTHKETYESDDSPDLKIVKKGIYVHESLAIVAAQGRRISALSNRHSLRKFLGLLLQCYPESVNKASLAGTVWGESYNPQIHDSRIYTSIQRLRELVRLKDCVLSTDQGYRWNPVHPFIYIRTQAQDSTVGGNPRVQGLLLHALESFAQRGRPWVSRSDLVEVAGSSDATVKRELARLLSEGSIVRRGAGRSVEYSRG